MLNAQTQLALVKYVDDKNQERTHDVCERVYERGGVDVAAFMTQEGKEYMILGVQYRPAIDKYCVGFPAGLIDKGENPEEAACRELKEETGYEGEAVSVRPSLPAHQGISTTYSYLVHMKVDGDKYKTEPEQKLEDGEYIKVIKIEKSKLLETLHRFSNKGFALDPKLYSLALGYAT